MNDAPPNVEPALSPLDPESAPRQETGADDARYGKQLDAWLENWKQKASEYNAAIAVEAARVDASTRVDNDRIVAQQAVNDARYDTEDANEFALLTALHNAYVDTTKSSLDRALTRLNFFTGAITAVTAIYTTMIGLSYSLPTATDANGIPLDFSAFIPVIFLGLALLLNTIYAALFREQRQDMSLLPSATDTQLIEARLVTFMDWCFGGILARRWALHGGITSFAIAIATLPVSFIRDGGDNGNQAKGALFVGGLVLVGAVCFGTWKRDSSKA